MLVVEILLIVVEVLCSLLLVGIILLQRTKSQGLGLAFGSGMGETLFGSRAGNVLSKMTIALAVVFLVDTSLLAVLFAGGKAQILGGRTNRPLMSRQAAPNLPGAPSRTAPAAAPMSGAAAIPETPEVSDETAAPVSLPAATPAPAAPQPAPAPAPATEKK